MKPHAHLGYTHGITVAGKFYENVDRDGENAILEFTPAGLDSVIVMCLVSCWVGEDGGELLSFAAITDEPPGEVATAGHDRCIIPLKPEQVDARLNPVPSNLGALYALSTTVSSRITSTGSRRNGRIA